MRINMSKISPVLRVSVGILLGAMALAISAQTQSRGELLYSTHCIACHTSQMHWRDQRVATDWGRLKAEVRRWQGAAALNWSEADINEVTRHLNESIYHFLRTTDPLAALNSPTADARAVQVGWAARRAASRSLREPRRHVRSRRSRPGRTR